MEKPTTNSSSSSMELQCVGRLEVVQPKPVGFLCGSIPVTTDKSYSFQHSFNSALVLSSQTVSAPRYRMLPTETDLNSPPPRVPSRTPTAEGVPWDDSAITSNLAKKGEALAVTGLVEYGDQIDVIAPADILKQIFKMPYSKARLSIAVHRVGKTLVLNAGPDLEEGERMGRRNQPKCSDESLFLNFAKQSVRMEACDCPPTHSAYGEGPSDSSANLPDVSNTRTSSFKSTEAQANDVAPKGHSGQSEFLKTTEESYWRSKKNKKKARDPVRKSSHVGEKSRFPVQESEKYRSSGDNEFLRVLIWQFHNFRMLLGSDLHLFSNDKYVAVSLHLWDVSRQVTPLTWLEAWLDNVMASVPELAICYHENGVVQGYELIKTDDIFLLKGVSDDGTPAFHPYVVQQNGLSVLRFLQENCKQDPGAYWLYKNAGEDVIQLFDLSVVPQSHASENEDSCSSSLPSSIHRGRADSLSSLGILLYRIAHRLSFSMAPSNKARCASFFRKCLKLLDEPDGQQENTLDEPDHLVICAFAHEQVARLILNSSDELDMASEALLLASDVTITDHEQKTLEIVSITSESSVQESPYGGLNDSQDLAPPVSSEVVPEQNVLDFKDLIASDTINAGSSSIQPHHEEDGGHNVCNQSSTSPSLVETVVLAAVHHVSRAIKSLGLTRLQQGVETEFGEDGSASDNGETLTAVCACGDTDCIEVCDIREWLPNSKLDHKLWKLVLLLGESYLALGQAYKEDGQLLRALKVVETACSVYGSVPQYLDDAEFISSLGDGLKFSNGVDAGQEKHRSSIGDDVRETETSSNKRINLKQLPSTYLFWAKAWTLVGDVYVDFLAEQGREISQTSAQATASEEMRITSSVEKELERLKKKLGQDVENCTLCSLVNCSCQSDRASSGSSASSSRRTSKSILGRRQGKKSHSRSTASLRSVSPEINGIRLNGDLSRNQKDLLHRKYADAPLDTRNTNEKVDKGEPLASHSQESRIGEDSTPSTTENGSKNVLDSAAMGHLKNNPDETTSEGQSQTRCGGIFKYLRGPQGTQLDDILMVALSCYEEAKKALGEVSRDSHELHAVLKKIGWVCNELGRNRLARKEMLKAEVAFAKAISAFGEVSDHTNVILINCNLGHGRRALAEELISKLEYFKSNSIFYNAYKQALEAAKVEYCKSLKYYGAAKSELCNITGEVHHLRNEVYTQLANTYLRLGMLLAREDTVADVCAEDNTTGFGALQRTDKEQRKSEISANDAIREALSLYESLGELRKQEAAYSYFQLACYQRDCCLKFVNSSHSNPRNIIQSKSESKSLQRAKQYISLAERNWQKALEFYSAQTHPVMHLSILIERASLWSSISSSFHSFVMLETALSCLLEGRHVSEQPNSEVFANFWRQLQMLLKKMLASSLPVGPNRASSAAQAPPSSKRSGGAEKLKKLYKISLKSTDFSQLRHMYSLWTGLTV